MTRLYVPERYRGLYDLNPLVSLLDAYRALLIAGRFPDWSSLAWLALLGGVSVCAGQAVLRHFSDRFVDEL